MKIKIFFILTVFIFILTSCSFNKEEEKKNTEEQSMSSSGIISPREYNNQPNL